MKATTRAADWLTQQKSDFHTDVAINRFRLSFTDVGHEKGYTQQCSERLKQYLFRALCLYFAFVVSMWVRLRDGQRDAIHFLVPMLWLILVLTILQMIVLRLPLASRLISPSGFEALGLSFAVSNLCLFAGFEFYYKVLLLDRKLDDYIFRIHGRMDIPLARARSDFRLILMICMFLSLVHHVVPFRFVRLVWIDLVAFIAYPISVLASRSWTSANNPLLNTLTIIAFVGLAMLGKHHSEWTERVLFSKYLAEKSLRVATEFRLAEEPRPPGPSSAAAVERIGTTVDLLEDLKGVLDLGRQEHWLVESTSLDFTISKVLGQGGFGKVCTARLHKTPVVVKMPKVSLDTLAGTEDKRLRMLGTELRILRRLRHPNIVAFHGAAIFSQRNTGKGKAAHSSGEGGSLQFGLVLERVLGVELHKFVVATSSDSFGILAADIAQALLYMHSQTPQVLHSDLKPANIMVEKLLWDGAMRPRAKLIDFGLARVLDPEGSWGHVGGTQAWMAPEQKSRSASPTVASDVYALGAVIGYMETGRTPQVIPGPNDVVRQFLSEESRSLAQRCLSACPGGRPSLALLCTKLEEDLAIELFESNETLRSTACSSGNGPLATPWWAVRNSLMRTMSRWSLPLREGTCCEHHAAVLILEMAYRELARRPCGSTTLQSDRQCSVCGMLEEVEHTADGFDGDVEEARCQPANLEAPLRTVNFPSSLTADALSSSDLSSFERICKQQFDALRVKAGESPEGSVSHM